MSPGDLVSAKKFSSLASKINIGFDNEWTWSDCLLTDIKEHTICMIISIPDISKVYKGKYHICFVLTSTSTGWDYLEYYRLV